MEIYTFLRMGGTVERIHVLPAEDHASATTWRRRHQRSRHLKDGISDAALDERRFEEFDVEAAECTMEKDKEHLLGVIEQGFGSFENFNELCAALSWSAEPNTTDGGEHEPFLGCVSGRVKPNPKARETTTRELPTLMTTTTTTRL